MIQLTSHMRIMVATAPVDMRNYAAFNVMRTMSLASLISWIISTEEYRIIKGAARKGFGA